MNASLTPNETTVQKVKLLIDGEWVESQTTEWHDIVNPATPCPEVQLLSNGR